MLTKNCKHCKKDFVRPYGLGFKLWDNRQFCTRACKDTYFRGKQTSIRTQINCAFCKTEFVVLPHRLETAKFCSQSCLAKSKIGNASANWKGGLMAVRCVDCKNEISYSAKRCVDCCAIARSGEHNHMWKGGVSTLVQRIRKSRAYKYWRKHVFQRDNYTCQACGEHGGKLNADHVMPFALYEDIRFEILNGRTLCEDCHRKTHTFGQNYIQFNNVLV